MIEIKNLRKEFGDVTPLKDVSVTVNKGDVIAVIGPSGTGKSTFIRCINLLEKPTSGQVIFNGTDITAKGVDIKKIRQKMGMVFQSFNLFGHLTVIENLMLAPMDLLKKSRQEAYDKAMEYLKVVGMEDKALSYPDELSGGQKQRVAIARTLCMDPEVVLLDEPTSALDPTMVSEVEAVIRDLSKSGKTMIIVTHEMNFARAISNRVFYMDEGGIYEEGTPEEIFDNPQKELTRRFVRRLRVLEATIEGTGDITDLGVQLERFFLKNGVPSVEKYRVRLVLEELVQQILLVRKECLPIHITLEYSEIKNSCFLSVAYSGESFDIMDSDNELSLKIIKNATEDLNYHFDEGKPLGNVVEAAIRYE